MSDEPATDDSDLDLLRRYVREYDDATQLQRAEGERARNYKDGIQWDADELAKKQKRNEAALVFNYIAQKINFLVGSEIRARVDPKALPRTPLHDNDVKAVTDALRYVKDDQRFDRIRTQLAEELLLSGLGAVVACVDDSKNDFPKIKLAWAPASRFFYDPHSSQTDYSDAKYLGVATWWDNDDIKDDRQYSKAKETIDQLASGGEELASFATDKPEFWCNQDRTRVQVFEIYWQVKGEWKTAHFCFAGYLIKPQKVTYIDEDGNTYCPVIGATAFITRNNVRYGLCRNLFDPQDEVNHRRSKALRDMSVKGFVGERSAVLNAQEFLTELAKPDCAAIVEDDALKDGRITIRDGQEMAAGQLQLLGEAKAAINDIGPSLSNIAESNATSGRAVLARQNIASIEMEPLFDNLRDWEKRLFAVVWLMVRQYWTKEIWLRVTDSEAREGYKFIGLNRRMTRTARLQELIKMGVHPEDAWGMIDLEADQVAQIKTSAQQQAGQIVMQRLGNQDMGQLPPQVQQQIQSQMGQIAQLVALNNPLMKEILIASNIGKLCMDIQIDTAPEIATIQQEQSEMFAEMIGKGLFSLPPPLIEVAISMSQLRDKDKLIDKLQKIQAQPAPDPMAQMQMQLQMQTMQVNLAKLQAQVEEVKSQTVVNLANAQAKGAQAQSEQAYAIQTMMHAGRESVPNPPIMAAQQQRQGGVTP